eukprot:1160635-Pelagomonas_calceolata.AAC.1
MLTCAVALTFAHAAPTVALAAVPAAVSHAVCFGSRSRSKRRALLWQCKKSSISCINEWCHVAIGRHSRTSCSLPYTPSNPCHDTPAASKLVAHTSTTTCILSTVAFVLPIAILYVIFCPSPGPFSGPFSGLDGGQNGRCTPSGRVTHFITIFSIQNPVITIVLLLRGKKKEKTLAHTHAYIRTHARARTHAHHALA